MFMPWNSIKRTWAQISNTWKRRVSETSGNVERPENNPGPPETLQTPFEYSIGPEPVLKKRKIDIMTSSPLSLFEPRIFETGLPVIDTQLTEHGGSSSIFSGFSNTLELFKTSNEELESDLSSVGAKDPEIPLRNPRRRLHEVAAKFRRSTQKTYGHQKNRHSSSHFSFDATQMAPLHRPPPPTDTVLVRQRSHKTSEVTRLAKDIDLDEDAVGSLLLILDED